MYLASVNSFGTISDTPFLSPKCPQYYLRPSPPHCGDMMTFVPNGISQGALALRAKHESRWQIEFGAPVLGLLTCGARSWRGTAVPWLQPKRCLSLLQFPASSGGSVANSGWLSLACFLLLAIGLRRCPPLSRAVVSLRVISLNHGRESLLKRISRILRWL